MIKELFQFAIGCFKSGEGRTQKLKRNVVWSFIIKVGQMLIALLQVPLLLTYLDPEKYGVWLTIVSIILWTHQFDLGLGSGLRYKLTEAIANNDSNRCKSLVSTAYVSLTAVMLGVFLLLLPCCLLINWNSVLNVHSIPNSELCWTVISVFFVFVMQFILDLVGVVLKADQRAAISDLFKPIGTLLSLCTVLILKLFSTNSLLYASLAMSLPYLLIMLGANFYFFRKSYRNYAPSIYYFRKSYIKDIYSLGIKYFVNQFSALVVFSTASILISKLIAPSEAAVYNIANTYFSLMVSFYTIILVPFSAAITDAYVRDDYQWIKNGMKKLNYVASLFATITLGMLMVSKFAFHIWVGDKIQVPLGLCIVMTIYNMLSVFVSPYSNFLGGVGKLHLGIYISLFKIITFIPTAIFAIKLWGSVGLVVSIILINTSLNLIFGYIQYHKIINRTARGIWNR